MSERLAHVLLATLIGSAVVASTAGVSIWIVALLGLLSLIQAVNVLSTATESGLVSEQAAAYSSGEDRQRLV
ncbi:hypothetical protein [Rhodococcoides yunnanense]|uniref:hypothetical protein n=1 Tax=Rhodococcoides yunnanense TaxID=278209 RepID=UPI000932CA76|nr:hypothetical protein [Rhodococcus yunnanensis]